MKGFILAVLVSGILWLAISGVLSFFASVIATIAGFIAGVCGLFVLIVVTYAYFCAPVDPDHRSSRRDDDV